MSHIAQERFHKGESSLISIDFLDGIHVAKLQESLPTGFDGRHASPKIVCCLHGNVIIDFGPQDFLVPRGRRPRGQPPEEPSQCFRFRP
jgi:hypothetical protein